MAPSHSRHLLVWTTLPIAVLLSYLWFRKKRTEARSDTGRTVDTTDQKKKDIETKTSSAPSPSPSKKTFSRSLSGVDSAPIDIVFPPALKSVKSSQIIISDEDLDLEIEKIKSMKNSTRATGLFNKKDCKKSKSQSDISSTTNESPVKKKVTLKSFMSPKKSVNSPKVDTKKVDKSIPEQIKTEMAQKDIVTVNSVEKKINNLKLDPTDSRSSTTEVKSGTSSSIVVTNEQDITRQSSERDSANHSPADVMLASPSLSSISDSHSEGSSDSGKGCSEVATSPSRTPAGDGSVAGDATVITIYEFLIPQTLVGRLIGRHGNFVTQIKHKTHAHILIKKHPESNKLKVCSIEGTQAEIDNALEMIRDKFPVKRYPEITLEQVIFAPPVTSIPLISEQLCLKLVEGINNDTIVSCMVAPNHLFLQQPTHPTFPNLNLLSNCMNLCYADAANSPMLPNPLPENPVCAAFSLGAWYRAIVLSTDTESDTSYIRFLDYGGYANVKSTELRQIRADFLMLPFQASECLLSNIRPAGGEDAEWLEEAFTFVADLTKGAILYTQVAEYTEEGIPLVLIYVVVGPQQVVFLNEELVCKGFAEWINVESDTREETIGA